MNAVFSPVLRSLKLPPLFIQGREFWRTPGDKLSLKMLYIEVKLLFHLVAAQIWWWNGLVMNV